MAVRSVSVEGLSKGYTIEARRSRLQETLLGQMVADTWQRLQAVAARFGARGSAPAESQDALHWALREVSFSIDAGETVGIIGHNGAGKSTLLKILSRITHPTSGLARVTGRMTSLLEVGTGFHPDLSGRDNIFMNAAILGMTRAEIARRFDDIVAFSGVDEYIDTPIKRYSSGMKVRLAFAVAAHLDPDVLLIDEVLAVGDAEFQKKCLSRIEQVARGGRTILFVSHNLPVVARLCRRVIWLDQGRVAFDGDALKAIGFYEEKLGNSRSARIWTDDAPGDGVARLNSVELLGDGSPCSGPVSVKSEVSVRLRYSVLRDGAAIMPSIHVFDMSGIPVCSALDTSRDWHGVPRKAGDYETVVRIPPLLLNEGHFSIAVAISTLQPFQNHLYVPEALHLTSFDPLDGSTAAGLHRGPLAGYFRPLLQWSTRRT